MKKYIIILICICTSFAACDDFLDVIPTGTLIPTTVDDYDKLLNNRNLHVSCWNNLAYMDPDWYMPDNHYHNIWSASRKKQYIWHEHPYELKENDSDWNSRYKYILIYNEVINNIDDALLGNLTESQRDLVKGEALAQRAMDYFLLVNEYAPHYSSSTIDEPAIPMPLEVNLQAQLPRSTVGEIYGQILLDLESAETLLVNSPAVNKDANFRPGMAGIKALLGTIYLYMGDWAKAEQYTSEALDMFDFLYDFNELDHNTPGEPWTALNNNREFRYLTETKSIIWGRQFLAWFYDPAHLFHPDLRDLYNMETDRRWYLFAGTNTWYAYDVSTLPNYVFVRDYAATSCGMSTPRLILANAEAKARSGKGQEAIDMLNKLAEYRYTTRENTFSFTNNAGALQEVKDERRRELCYTGINFIDQKRYHAYGETISTFTRLLPTGETYTLEPGSDKWVVPIARIVQNANPNL